MNLQPQQKASNKRTGKRITFFSDQPSHHAPSKEQQLKEQQFYGSVARLPVSQASDFSTASNNMLNTVMYAQEIPEAMRLNQQQVVGKWNVAERGDSTWQAQQAGMWQRNTPSYPVSMVHSYYNHHEPIKRSQDKGVGVSQVDTYGDAIQQMMSQKAQLEQHTLARQQAHLNSILQVQQQQQHQQQQQQQQHQQQQQQQQQQHQQQQQQQQQQQLSLQPFQMAFGHQGQKPSLQEIFHVFPEAQSNVAYASQQKQQPSLPKMQLFENFYQAQQQQQQSAYGMQQAIPVAQPHQVAQQKMHVIGQPQRAPTSEEYMKALVEQSQQTVMPKTQIPLPRRSRRLSKEGVPPLPTTVGGQSSDPYAQHHYDQTVQKQPEVRYKHSYQPISRDAQIPSQESHYDNHYEPNKARLPQNGSARDVQTNAEQNSVVPSQPDGAGAVTVIQTTRRRRRISQEANLFTLAQKAVEIATNMENTKDRDASKNKENENSKASTDIVGVPSPKKPRLEGELRPLVMPVSVPVKIEPVRELGDEERMQRTTASERESSMQSVIVTRHRAGQTTIPEPVVKPNETSLPLDGETVSRKPKQRPRPEPLFIPPKPGTFVVPVYTNITSYQSHLRSPVRMPEHLSDKNFELPPYTPPPILSPVREGSGLYFNAIMSASSHSMPPPITPKSSTRTLLRSTSEDMPPILTAMGDATPVSLEPRINVGSRFQAEIPECRDRSLASVDKYKADLVWCPWEDLENNQVEELLTAACSSILPGGGTNQELALHYLHESKGDILAALTKLLLKMPRRHQSHPLENYHYSGSDKWSTNEKRLFNKGMAIYKKDFLLVQKLIKTKTVSQCVEFYYTYKKQVKIGRNGMLIFGDVEAATDEKNPREDSEIDIKSSQRLSIAVPSQRESSKQESTQDPNVGKEVEENTVQVKQEEEEEEVDRRQPAPLIKVTQTLQASEITTDTLILRSQDHETSITEKNPRQRSRSPRVQFSPENTRKPTPQKQPPAQEGSFPCKKCGRVFFKVKSRSAHMKSHAEQEKKAAAQRQSEAAAAAVAAAAAAAARAALHARSRRMESSDSGSSSDSSCESSSESSDSSDDGDM